MAIMEIIVKAQDQASAVMETVQQKGTGAAQALEANWTKVAAAGVVVGGAMEMAARKQAPLTESTRRLADSMGMTEGGMRELAIATSDVTFPLDEVLGLMEIGVQRGLEGEAALQKFAQQMDFVGDATGLSSQAIAESTVALEMAGISADNISDAFDAFGYITENTTSNVEEFNKFVGRVGKEMGDNTPHIDDMAAALGALEDNGFDAQLAQRELQSALRETDGDMGKALETLGISQDEFAGYQDAVKGSSDILERNAEIHGDSYTAMQKLQHRAEELQYQYGDLIGVVGNFAPLMMALGPAIKLVSLAKGAYTTATKLASVAARGFGAAIRFAMGPIGLIMIAITALIAIIWYLYNNWDEVSALITALWDKATGYVLRVTENLRADIAKVWDGITGKVAEVWNWIESNIIEKVTSIYNAVTGWFGKLNERIRVIWDGILAGIKGSANSIISAIESMINWSIDNINSFIGSVNRAIDAINRFSPVTIGNIPTLSRRSIPRLAEGGIIRGAGAVLVGEEGPELLSLPQGARVDPLSGASPLSGGSRTEVININFNRGSLEGLIATSEADLRRLTDKLGESIVERIRYKQGLKI